MSEAIEVLQTLDRLNAVLADLVIRGLRAAGQAELAPLDALGQELDRVGAAHLAGKVSALSIAIRNNEPAAGMVLLETQISLRLFERILTTLEAEGQLTALTAGVNAAT